MSKNNDEKVKTILESNEIPQELEPENIKAMLDRKKIRNNKGKKATIIKVVSGAAACAVICTYATTAYIDKNKNVEHLLESSYIGDYLTDSETHSEADTGMYMSGAHDYTKIYSYFRKPEKPKKQSAFDKVLGFFGVKNDELNDVEIYEEDFVYENAVDIFNGMADMDDGLKSDSTTAVVPETEGSGSDLRGEEESNEYSDTYNQEEGVEEADIVKTDGNNIYYCYDDEIRIASVDSGKFTATYEFSPKKDLNMSDDEWLTINDMYLIDGRLIIITTSDDGTEPVYRTYNGGICDCVVNYNNEVSVFVYKAGLEPEFISSYTQEGTYNTVRMIDGYLYLVTDTASENYKAIENKDDLDAYIPKYSCDGNEAFIPADCILVPSDNRKELTWIQYTVIGGMNVLSDAPSENVNIKALADYTGNIYCSKYNLYAAAGLGDETSITRIELSEGRIIPSASGTVKGYVLNQFSMSEHNGYFRIATTINNIKEIYKEDGNSMTVSATNTISNALFILDMGMNIVGEVKDFGKDETIKSVNYNGDLAYVVTYEQTDPLFAIDTSNPENPVILDEFKINGYSTYMQKWSDGLLLGFGIDADEYAIERGVKLVMFDTSDPNNLKEVGLATYSSTEKYIYSSAIWERKNLYIDAERNIISFPVNISEYKTEFKNVFYSYENGEFIKKGEINLSEDAGGYSRVLYINGYLYLVQADQFISLTLDTIEIVESIKWER